MPIVAKIGTEYLLFGGAGLISVVAFAALILVPAIGSFGRTWEKATAAVGLSRVYLGVHYLSDVSGGWALGVMAFAGCAAVALVVAHLRRLRQNPGE